MAWVISSVALCLRPALQTSDVSDIMTTVTLALGALPIILLIVAFTPMLGTAAVAYLRPKWLLDRPSPWLIAAATAAGAITGLRNTGRDNSSAPG